MAAKYILGALACAFFFAAALQVASGGSLRHPQTRTWLTVAAIFAAVSAWLFYSP